MFVVDTYSCTEVDHKLCLNLSFSTLYLVIAMANKERPVNDSVAVIDSAWGSWSKEGWEFDISCWLDCDEGILSTSIPFKEEGEQWSLFVSHLLLYPFWHPDPSTPLSRCAPSVSASVHSGSVFNCAIWSCALRCNRLHGTTATYKSTSGDPRCTPAVSCELIWASRVLCVLVAIYHGLRICCDRIPSSAFSLSFPFRES